MSCRPCRDDWLRFVIRGLFPGWPKALGLALIGTVGGDRNVFDDQFVGNGRQRMRPQPKGAGTPNRIDADLAPPLGFIAVAVDLAMMASA